MATSKPQIRSAFPTPICVHYLPVAIDVNAELRPLVLERMQSTGANLDSANWRSAPDFESWGGLGAQTLFRMLRDLADGMTCTRAGGRVALEWNIVACADVRQKDGAVPAVTHPGAFWAGVYFVDDGYGKSDDETLGGECEVKDPRGSLPADLPPHLGFRVPGGATVGMSELIRPKSGMILMHPGWVAGGERSFTAPGPRVTVAFELSLP